MSYFSKRLEFRVAVSVVLGTALFCVAFIHGPVDDPWRAVVVGGCAGALSAALAGFCFPGWPAFSAALAFVLVGLLEPLKGRGDWLYESALVLYAAAAWAAAWPLGRFGIEQAFAVEFQMPNLPPRNPKPSLPIRVISGLFALALVAGSLTLVCLWAFPLLPVLAFPAALLITVWALAAVPRVAPLWPISGSLLALPLAFCLPDLAKNYYNDLAGAMNWRLVVATQAEPSLTPGAARYPFDLAYLPPESPWILAGLILCGTVIGYWLVLLRTTHVHSGEISAG